MTDQNFGHEAFNRALDYANSVLEGQRLAGKFERLACERFGRDIEREDWDYELDSDEAARWCAFLESLSHVKGRWAAKKQKIELSGWQAFVVINVYGWRHKETGLRRFRDVYLEVARKNGKSTLMGGIGLGHLCIDDEFGAEVYCGATSEKQAHEVFGPARKMALWDEAFRSQYDIEVNAKSLVIQTDGSKFEPVIGDPGDGASPSCSIHDEFHEHANSNQVDTMSTGMGAREQPVQWHITTAGSSIGGPCYEKRAELVQILEGGIEDDTVFGIIYTVDQKDRWNDPAILEKANPNIDVSVSRTFLLGELKKAERTPSKQVAYRTKHLNQWVGAKAAWMNMLKLQACGRKSLRIGAYKKKRCYIGLDLASKIDFAVRNMLFVENDIYTAFYKRWLPEAVIESNKRYQAWSEAGLIEATPGEIIDFDLIEDDLEGLQGEFDIIEVGYDPFQATQFATHMTDAGFPMVQVGQTVKNFSEPMKELEAVIYDGRFRYWSGDLLVPWMFGNVTARKDKKQNIYPDRERDSAKIDDVVATLISMNRSIVADDDTFNFSGLTVV